jgi:hypothetical protein
MTPSDKARLDEIRKRWTGTGVYTDHGYRDLLYDHAPSDLAFLLAEVERLTKVGLGIIERHGQTLDAYQCVCEERDRERERAEKAEQARDAALSLATELLARFKCTGRVTYADGREVRSYAVLQGVSGAEYNAWCARLSPSDRIEPTPKEGKD